MQLFMAPIAVFTILLTVGAKIYRVQRIAYSKVGKRVKITDGFILKCICGSLAVLIVFLVCYLNFNSPEVYWESQKPV